MCYHLYNPATDTYLHGDPPEATLRELVFIGLPPTDSIDRGPRMEWHSYSEAWTAKAMLEARGVLGFHVCYPEGNVIHVLKDAPIAVDIDLMQARRIRLNDIPG